MDPIEAGRLEAALRETMRSTGYGWIVEQVDATAQEAGDPSVDDRKRAAREPTEDAGDAYARLRALISALRYAVEEGGRLREEVGELMLGEQVEAVRLVDESGEQAVMIDRDAPSSPAGPPSRELTTLLDELREIVDEPRG